MGITNKGVIFLKVCFKGMSRFLINKKIQMPHPERPLVIPTERPLVILSRLSLVILSVSEESRSPSRKILRGFYPERSEWTQNDLV
jgi:hypothetical protein